MKRFIRYLYEYGQGRRLRNVGFVKAEQGDSDCTLHIHGKGLHMKGERKLNLYLFYEDGDECIGIWQGTVDNVNPAINYRLYYTEEDVGSPENFEKINGMILESELGHRYAAVWNDMPVDVGHMRTSRQSKGEKDPDERKNLEEVPGSKKAQRPEEESEEVQGSSEESLEPEEESELGEMPGSKEEPGPEEMQRPKEEPEPGEMQRPKEEPGPGEMQRPKEEPEPGEMQRPKEEPEPGETQRPKEEPGPEEMQEQEEELEPEEAQGPEETSELGEVQGSSEETPGAEEIPGSEAAEPLGDTKDLEEAPRTGGTPCRCTKIRRNDLARLPRCEWKWANNSFLLHGYYNYHHLALIDDGGRHMLGVPGIYHPQEAKAASVFGFTEFVPIKDVKVELSDDEGRGQEPEQFGYWCRPVKRPLKM